MHWHTLRQKTIRVEMLGWILIIPHNEKSALVHMYCINTHSTDFTHSIIAWGVIDLYKRCNAQFIRLEMNHRNRVTLRNLFSTFKWIQQSGAKWALAAAVVAAAAVTGSLVACKLFHSHFRCNALLFCLPSLPVSSGTGLKRCRLSSEAVGPYSTVRCSPVRLLQCGATVIIPCSLCSAK